MNVVILGGGFAGISAAIELIRQKKSADIEVDLVSDQNYFVFQPLLPEVVSCGIEATHILSPIRQLCRGVRFHYGVVSHIDHVDRTVTIKGSEEKCSLILSFDHLVLSIGTQTDLSRFPGMR